MANQCEIPGCGRPHLARGWCQRHYAKWNKYGDPLKVVAVPAKTVCSVPGCIPKGRIKAGLCNKHYMRLKTTGSVDCLKLAPRGAPKKFIEDLLAGQIVAPDGECIIWPYGRNAGYAAVSSKRGSRKFVHQILCEALHGPPPPKHECRHLCGKGADGCVTPAHLCWGTHHENMKDKTVHGAHNPPRGEAQWMARLTADDIRMIRSLAADGHTQQSIADRYGVIQAHISAIVRRKKWAWLE